MNKKTEHLSYKNLIRNKRALGILNTHDKRQSVLEVDGGVGPYCGSTHIIDIQPYMKEKMEETCWEGKSTWDDQAVKERLNYLQKNGSRNACVV